MVILWPHKIVYLWLSPPVLRSNETSRHLITSQTTYKGSYRLLSQFAEGLCQAAWGRVPKRSHACYWKVSLFARCLTLFNSVKAKTVSKEKFIVDEITLVFGAFLNAIFVKKSDFNNTDVARKGQSSYILFTAMWLRSESGLKYLKQELE